MCLGKSWLQLAIWYFLVLKTNRLMYFSRSYLILLLERHRVMPGLKERYCAAFLRTTTSSGLRLENRVPRVDEASKY
jgi:hypothetical protein